MSRWRLWKLAVRFARRELAAAELTILGVALLIAVTAMTSVGFFSDRVERALLTQASQLLAADLVINADKPVNDQIRKEAIQRGLSVAESITFPSMVFANDQAMLASYKAVSNKYPLRGDVTIRNMAGKEEKGALHPAPGTAWADEKLLSRLRLKLGDSIRVGNTDLRLTGVLMREPDGSMDLYNFVPRLLFNRQNLAETGLMQEGTRARWRLLLAGNDRSITDFRTWVKDRLAAGDRLENVEDARPEVRNTLDKARRFLGLTTMLTVALSAAAVGLAIRRYLVRHWQAVAILQCLGLTPNQVLSVFIYLFLIVGLLSGVIGTLLGYLGQEGLMQVSSWYVGEVLPEPSLWLWVLGPAVSLILLAGMAVPPLMVVRQVSAVSIFRMDMPVNKLGVGAVVIAVVSLLGLAAWQVGDVTLALWILLGVMGFFAAVALVAWVCIYMVRFVPGKTRIGWRFGLANIARRPWMSMIQIVALSIGMMALLTLTMVRSDLITAWQRSVPVDAPNQFMLNIQEAQKAAISQFFASSGMASPELAPMIRGRLMSINDRAIGPGSYADERARRLIQREFNLSWRSTLPKDNVVVAGHWWTGKRPAAQLSVEKGLAESLGIVLGDTLVFDVSGSEYRAKVTSIRQVAWDSFRVNFFVIGSPGFLADQPTSWISSFHLDPGNEAFINQLVGQFPNVTVIDVSSILNEIRTMVDKLTRAVEAMFGLALAAGVLVLWAALMTTKDERVADIGVMRAIGASRQQVRSVFMAEFLWLGALTGTLAGAGAMGIGMIASTKLFNLDIITNWSLLPVGMLSGMVLVCLGGGPILLRLIKTPPMAVLREL